MAKKSKIINALVNHYPEWSDIRQDEQSVGQQYLNVVGNQLEELQEQNQTLGKNYFVTTANVKDIDIVYKFDLPKNYIFQQDDSDEANQQIVAPTVSGLIGTTWHDVILASGNNIETFWYTSIPNRITCAVYPLTNSGQDNSGSIVLGQIVEGYEVDSPLYPSVSGVQIDNPTKLLVEVFGGTEFIRIDDNKNVTRGIVTLTGMTRENRLENETLVFIHNDIQQTNKEWSRLIQVDVQDIIDKDTTKVRVLTNRFGRNQDPRIPEYLDSYNLNDSIGSKQPVDIFWDISTSVPRLDFITYVFDDIRDRISGLTDKQILRSFELLKQGGSDTIGTPKDLAVEPFSHRIWVIDDNNYLYLYDDELTVPSMRILDKKQTDAMAVLQPSSYHTTINDSFTMTYFWRRPIKDIAKHRVYVQAPDGTKYTVDNGTLITLDLNGSWVFGTPLDRNLRHTDNFTLTQRGDWLWTMDIVYIDTTTETDQRIVSVDYKTADIQFDLSTCIDSTYSAVGIDFDSDQIMWLVAYSAVNGDYKKYKVNFYTDVMMIDYDKKSIFLKTAYDQLKVEV